MTHAGVGTPILVKPGESIQYSIQMAGTSQGVGRVLLEYSTDGGAVYKAERDKSDALIDYEGTVGDPLLATECLGSIVNESAKNRLYRWRCVSFAGTHAIPCYLYKMPKAVANLYQDIYLFVDNDAPQSGIDGDGVGVAGKGSFYINNSAATLYINDGDARMPSWKSL